MNTVEKLVKKFGDNTVLKGKLSQLSGRQGQENRPFAEFKLTGIT